MDPSYVNVVETGNLVWTLFAYVAHGALVAAHSALAALLILGGTHDLLRPAGAGRFARRLGALSGLRPNLRALGGARAGMGLLLLAPLAFGAPMVVSLLACVAGLGLLLHAGRVASAESVTAGRGTRRVGVALGVLAAAFMVFEGEDNLALALDVVLPAMEWRAEEIAWQLEADSKSPKLGELAPDFELKDPAGVTRVKLSEFRGKRPVALVFGSYT